MKKQFLYLLLVVCNGALAQENINEEPEGSESIERIEVRRQWQPYRGNVSLADTPQTMDSINADVLENSGITRFQEALDFSSSVVRQNSSGGMWDSFAIRGFAGDENNASGYLVNGFNVGRGYNGRRSTANVETIEVMKGSGSALYGQGEPGGTINIITKKPQFTEEGYIQATLGNNNTKQAEFDYTNAFNDDVAYRLNGSYEDSDSYRDFVYLKSLHLSPSVLWNISETTSLSYEMEILDQEKPFDRGVYVLNNDFDATSPEDFYGDEKDGAHTVKAWGHQLSLNHIINDDWHLLVGFAYRDSSFKGNSSDAELSEDRQLIYDDPNSLSRQRRERDYQARDLSTRIELTGELELAGLKNNVLFGVDHYNYHVDTELNRWRTAWGSGDPTYSIDPHNPDYDQEQPETSPQTNTSEHQKGLGLYVQDQIEVTDKSSLLVGVRVDKFKQDIFNYINNEAQNQDRTEVNPRIGFMYKMNDNIKLYTNYAEGFRPNPGIDSTGNAFDPEESNSYEVGAMWEDIDGRFSGSVALFDAQKSNMLTADPVNSDFSATLGEVESKGVEFELITELTDNTSVELVYSYTDAKTANEVQNADWGTTIPKGSRLINVAENIGHVSLNHFTTLNGYYAFFGLTVSYTGDRLGQTTDMDYILPSYTLVNVYSSVDLSENITVKFDVNNLLDEEYFESSYHELWTMPGAPTNYRLSLKYQF